jgi:phosphatidylglycerol:prolipoprotein diacylglycerol transferase
MTVDLYYLADALRWLLVVAGVFWISYAWLRRIEYRRVALVLIALVALDLLAHGFAAWVEQSGSPIPTDYSIFSLLILLGSAAGLGCAYLYISYRGGPREARISPAVVLDAALIVVILGGIGARAYHVWTHWDYYGQNLDDIANLRQGGMGLRGALVVGLLALWLFSLVRRVSFWKLADASALALALAQSIGWYGAWLVGVNYGIVSDASFAQDLPDVYGLIEPRVPVQLIASMFFLLLFVVLLGLAWRRRHAPGFLFLCYWLSAALGGFALGYVRGDDTLYLGALRVDQLVDAGLAGLGLVLVGVRLWGAPPGVALPTPAEGK